MRKLTIAAALSFALILPVAAQEAQTAVATFINVEGTEVGSVTLTQGDGTVAVTGEVTGITPGQHGFHFHETGDCDSSAAFESAGGHFNPTAHQHGLENPEGPHAGDLPNVEAAAEGTAAVDVTTDLISLTEGDPAYVFDADGTALVIHAGPDDNVTDPSGNSGDRVACAVIEADTQP